MVCIDRKLYVDHGALAAGQHPDEHPGGDRPPDQAEGAQPERQPAPQSALLDLQAEGAAGALAQREPDQAAHPPAAREGQDRQALPHLLLVPKDKDQKKQR